MKSHFPALLLQGAEGAKEAYNQAINHTQQNHFTK